MSRCKTAPLLPRQLTTHGVRQLFQDTAGDTDVCVQVLGIYRCTYVRVRTSE